MAFGERRVPPLQHRVLVDLAEIARQRFQREIELVERDRSLVHDDLVVHLHLLVIRVVGADPGRDLVALAPQAVEPPRDGEAHIPHLKRAHVGHEVHRHDLGSEAAVAGHDLDMPARFGDLLGRHQRGVIARIIVDQDVLAGCGIAGQDVPARDGQRRAFLEDRYVRQPAGGDDDHVGILRDDVFGFGESVEMEGDVARGALRHAPVDDADHLGPALGLRGQANLPAGFGGRFEDGDVVTAFRGDACRLEACRARADNHRTLARRGRGHDVGQA